MVFQREKQNVAASQLLQALADGDDIQLSRCTITGLLDINRLFDPAEKFQNQKLDVRQNQESKTVIFAQSIVYNNCVFEDSTVFTGPWSQSQVVTVEFKSDVIFNSSTFKAQARFRNATFGGTAGFDGCRFDSIVTFKDAVFDKAAKFRTVIFNGFCMFSNAVFSASARFTNSHFAKGVNFSEARFHSNTDFNGVYSSSRAVPNCDSILFARHLYGDDESFWRFVKQSAQEAGYYHLAGEWFYKERCARLWHKMRGRTHSDTLRPFKKFTRMLWSLRLLPELIFGRLLFGYGERPVRILVASAIIIVLCAFFYSRSGLLLWHGQPAEQSFPQGLYFSTITFTTLGYGDLHPAADGYCRLVAMIEAIAGASLMALFVVCLAKRFSRG